MSFGHGFPDGENPPDPTLDEVWNYLFANLADFEKGYLRRVHPISLHDSTLIVSVSDEFTRTRVESKVRATVEGLLQDFFTRPISVAITIDADLAEDLFFDESAANDDNSLASSFGLTNTPVLGIREGHDEAHLNPKYTFDTFVIGESNRFAHAAAIAVAENPGNAFNPLLIYGDSGLGKTHLLHAIGHYVQNYQDPGERLRVKYVSTEELTNDFINSIAVNKMAEFRRRYREDIDVLLVDDVQFIETRLQTQEEFFHTFNALHTAQKQIVLTSDRHPQALTTLEPRLRSRFEWGLMADVQPPSLETRMAILRRKVISDSLNVSNDVLEFIASRIHTNIRELEGALTRVTAYASLQNQPLDLPLAEHVLEDLLPSDSQLLVTTELIQTEVSAYYEVGLDALTGPDRTQSIATARQVAMYLCRELTNLSLPKIGQAFGGRDHTTVMHAVNKIKNLLPHRRDLFDQVTELTTKIRSAAH